MDNDLRDRINTFFDYWRKRHLFISRLDFRENNHEANVLIWASLDALSGLWASNIGEEKCKQKMIKNEKRRIFDAFLSCYGDDVFQLVSLPDIWSRVDSKHTKLAFKSPGLRVSSKWQNFAIYPVEIPSLI